MIPILRREQENLKTQTAYLYRMELEPNVKMLHAKFIELKQFHHLLSLTVYKRPSNGAGSLYLQNVLLQRSTFAAVVFGPKEGAAELIEREAPCSDYLNMAPAALLGRHIRGCPAA